MILYVIEPYVSPIYVILSDLTLYGFQFALLTKKLPNQLILAYFILLAIPLKFPKSSTEMGILTIFYIAHLILFPTVAASFVCIFTEFRWWYLAILMFLFATRMRELIRKPETDIEAQLVRVEEKRWNFKMLD